MMDAHIRGQKHIKKMKLKVDYNQLIKIIFIDIFFNIGCINY